MTGPVTHYAESDKESTVLCGRKLKAVAEWTHIATDVTCRACRNAGQDDPKGLPELVPTETSPEIRANLKKVDDPINPCLLYTSPSPRD